MRKNVLLLTVVVIIALTAFKPLTDEWREYTPENSKCTIAMPGEPSKRERVVNSAIGDLKLIMYMFQPADGTDDNVLYGVSFSDFPEGTIHSDSASIIKQFLDNTRDGAIKSIQGKLLSEVEINYKQYPGREQWVDYKNGMATINFRYYLVKNRLYTLQVITLADKSNNKSIGKFMSSFKLVD